jgi:hypothetical protein
MDAAVVKNSLTAGCYKGGGRMLRVFKGKRLPEFEVASERLKQIITDYQAGAMRREMLIVKLGSLRYAFRSSLKPLGNVGEALYSRLETAYKKIVEGDDEFVVHNPASYHHTVWEAHRLLVDAAKKTGFKHHGNVLIGWKSYRDAPLEIRELSKPLPRAATVLITDNGWVAYITPAGGRPGHFTIVKKAGEGLEISLSDFMRTRTNAVVGVLSSLGFGVSGTKTIRLDDENSNYMVDMRGGYGLLGALIQVLFRSQHMFWLELDAATPEEKERRETLVIRRLLEEYTKRPHLPYIMWGEFICFSDLHEILGSCPEGEMLATIDKLLQLSKAEAKRVLRQEYHFEWFRYYTDEELAKEGLRRTRSGRIVTSSS